MDWSAPLQIDFGGQSPPNWRRLSLFFGHYDARAYLTPTAYLDVGAGSWNAIRWVTQIPEGFSGSLGSVGRYCETATCEIMFRGEHDNNAPVNISFSGAPLLGQIAQRAGLGLASKGGISVGNAVVISSGAKVLPGCAIGDGAVIGAGAVVTKDVEPWTIAAGVPAKALRKRPVTPAAPWWDFATEYLCAALPNLQTECMRTDGHKAREPHPRVALRLNGPDLERAEFRGFYKGDDLMKEMPEKVRAYVTQALGPGPHYWLADCWA